MRHSVLWKELTGFQADVFRRWPYEPSSCIFPYLEAFTRLAENFYKNDAVDCMDSPFTKITYISTLLLPLRWCLLGHRLHFAPNKTYLTTLMLCISFSQQKKSTDRLQFIWGLSSVSKLMRHVNRQDTVGLLKLRRRGKKDAHVVQILEEKLTNQQKRMKVKKKKSNLLKYQMDILECKNIIFEIKKSLDDFSSRLNTL